VYLDDVSGSGLNQSIKANSALNKFLIRIRHLNASCLLAEHAYNTVSPVARQQMQSMFLLCRPTNKDLKSISDDFNPCSQKLLKRCAYHCCDGLPGHWFAINVQKGGVGLFSHSRNYNALLKLERARKRKKVDDDEEAML